MDKIIIATGIITLALVIALTISLSTFDVDFCIPFNGMEHNGETFNGYVGWC